MRSKLQKFIEFTNSLLPHETAYLINQQKFIDEERFNILKQIDYNCQNIHQFTPYDEGIDKRTYSHLKTWISNRLEAIDVDVQYQWISEMDQKIMTDSILPVEEQKLLKAIRNYQHPMFFFMRFYELVQHYRQFLLIRIRYTDHKCTDDFLKKYETSYLYAKQTYEQLHLATQDIVNHYKAASNESIQWEKWLTQNFYNQQLDGLNRYQALIRLNFIGFNYRKFDTIVEKFDYLDEQFKMGNYYSKRLLINYYGNRLLVHSKFRELGKAAYYGYLSIRSKNHDYLYYLTNLCAILLRQKKHKEALEIMKQGATEAKSTKNMHVKIGYIAFYIECLNACEHYKNAENYALTYLKAYAKEIKEYRWHLFFSAYLKAVLQQRKYKEVIAIIRQNRLLEKENEYQNKATYLPTILWFKAVAEYQEGIIGQKELYEVLHAYKNLAFPDEGKQFLLDELRTLVNRHI